MGLIPASHPTSQLRIAVDFGSRKEHCKDFCNDRHGLRVSLAEVVSRI